MAILGDIQDNPYCLLITCVNMLRYMNITKHTLVTGKVVYVFNKSLLQMVVRKPRVSFSPESGGRVNPRRAMEEMSTQGTIRLKK